MQRYGSLNSNKFSSALSELMERDVKIKAEEEKDESVAETLHLAEEKKQLTKSPSISLAFYLSKDADSERLDKMVTKNTDESSKLTVPVDFLCPVSLELMKDPVIVSTGQVWFQDFYSFLTVVSWFTDKFCLFDYRLTRGRTYRDGSTVGT